MATVASKLLTAEEFYDFVHRPENRDRVFELERGEIVEMSRPGKRHGLVCGNASGILWAFSKNPPLVSIEVLSPNDSPGKVNRRVKEQLRFGVQLVWVLDPEARNVTVYRAGKEHVVFEETEELTCDDVLPGFRCLVAEFFKLPGQ